MSQTRIDIHHHLLLPEYVEEMAKIRAGTRTGEMPFPRWKLEDSLAVMDRTEIQTAMLSFVSPGLSIGGTSKESEMARRVNEFAAQSVTRWPERFGFFATLPLPDVEAALAEITYVLDTLQADGIVLLSNYGGIYLGDTRFDAIFAELDRRAAVIFIHPAILTGPEAPMSEMAGSPIPALPSFVVEFVFDTTRAVANLIVSGTLKKYPHLRIILSHAGGTVPFVAQRIATGVLFKTFAMQHDAEQAVPTREQVDATVQAFIDDVLGQLQGLYYDTALSTNLNAFSSLRQLVPASQILLGTDYPFTPEWETRGTVNRLTALPLLNEQERQNIAGGNALKLFPRLAAMWLHESIAKQIIQEKQNI